MEEKKKKIRDNISIIVFILLMLISVTIGYAIVSTNLTINGITNLKRSEWKVHFDNVRQGVGSEFVVVAPTATSNGTIINFSVDMNKKDDVYEFTVDVYNEGTIDAELSNYLKVGLTSEQEEYVDYDLTYDDGSALNVGDKLFAGERKKLKVRVKYLKLFPINEDDLTDTAVQVNLSFKVDYVQI